MKRILTIFLLLSFTNVMGQSQNEPVKPVLFTITDYILAGLSKKHVTIVAYYNYNSYFLHRAIATEAAGVEFWISLDENYNLFDVNEEITGAKGNTAYGSTTLTYDKTTFIKFKYGFDNEELMNGSYYNYFDENKNRLFSGEIVPSLLKHTNYVIQTKVDNQIVKFRINLNNPSFHQFLQNCTTYTAYKKALEKATKMAQEEKGKAEKTVEEEAKRKVYEEFQSNYGYLFNCTATTSKPDMLILNRIDSFVAGFKQGKIPKEAIFDDKGNAYQTYRFTPGNPCDIILKTSKEVSFYQKDINIDGRVSLVEKGVLPKGKLIRFVLRDAWIQQIGSKKYLNVGLDLFDPFGMCKNTSIIGLILLDSLEFGNYLEIEAYRKQVKEFVEIYQKLLHGDKKPCDVIYPQN